MSMLQLRKKSPLFPSLLGGYPSCTPQLIVSLADVTGEPHDGQLADCYALGATIFCIKFGRPPFIGKGGQHNQKLLDLYHQIKHSKLVFPDAVGCGLKDLISRLMLKDPMRRM